MEAIALLAAAFAVAPPSRAETTACIVVNNLPATLGTPGGHYCLARDFTPTLVGGQRAILIDADDIVLDCNNYLVRNNDSAANVSGITAIDRSRITIRNCIIDGFSNGVQLYSEVGAGTTGNVVENNLVRNSSRIGILVSGSSHRISGNRIYRVAHDFNGVTYGIALNFGSDNQVRDNVLGDFVPPPPGGVGGTTYGISISDQSDAQVTGNFISALYANTGSPVIAFEASTSLRTTVSGNTVLSAPPVAAPLDGPQANGLLLYGTAEEQATNVCADNVVGHFGDNIAGCVEVGNTEL